MRKALFIFFFCLSGILYSQKTTRILFILDASNSMNLDWDKQTRMAAAKEILSQAIEKLRGVEDLEIALRVYGHQSMINNEIQDCNDTKLEVPFGKDRIDAINQIPNGLVFYEPMKTTRINCWNNIHRLFHSSTTHKSILFRAFF